jgi:hypothetical protein
MPEQQGTLNQVGDAVFAVLSVPVSALHGFDDDGDGLLSAEELERHRAALRDEIDRRFIISSDGAPAQTVRVDLFLSIAHGARTDRAVNVLMLKHARLAAPPSLLSGELGLRSDLFGVRPDQRALTITATREGLRGKESETFKLTPPEPEHRFFTTVFSRLISSLRSHLKPLVSAAATL